MKKYKFKPFFSLKRWFDLMFYKQCLRETLIRTIKGEQGLELARRFFNYKIYQLSKPRTKTRRL